MGVVTKYGSGYQDPAVSPADPLPSAEISGKLHQLVSTVVVTNGNSISSKFYFGKVPSAARLHKLSRFDFDGLTGVTDFDFGDAETADALVNGADLHTAGNASAVSAVNIDSLNDPLWELLGYDEDPNTEISLFGTLKAAATATGDLTLTLLFVLPHAL